MRPTVTRGAQHNYQKPENWDEEKDGPCGDLQVRKELYGERGIIQCVSTWKPSAEELRALLAGGVIELLICSVDQPPCALCVVRPVASIATPDLAIAENGVGTFTEPGTGSVITINEEAHGHG